MRPDLLAARSPSRSLGEPTNGLGPLNSRAPREAEYRWSYCLVCGEPLQLDQLMEGLAFRFESAPAVLHGLLAFIRSQSAHEIAHADLEAVTRHALEVATRERDAFPGVARCLRIGVMTLERRDRSTIGFGDDEFDGANFGVAGLLARFARLAGDPISGLVESLVTFIARHPERIAADAINELAASRKRPIVASAICSGCAPSLPRGWGA
jgi:hypothetical protein